MTPSPAPPEWIERFELFSVTHLMVVIICAALTAVAVAQGRHWRGTAELRRWERRIALAALLLWLAGTTWFLLPANFDWAFSLPLHLCDIAGLIAPLAILTNRRSLRALLYFWGLGLNTQAFITPLVQDGPAHLNFLLFWLLHLIVVGGAIYDLAARRFRPAWQDFSLALATSAAYLALVLPIDIIFGFNYGFVGPGGTSHSTVLDLLGPWPWRVVVIALLVPAAMAAMMLPWEMARRFRAQ